MEKKKQNVEALIIEAAEALKAGKTPEEVEAGLYQKFMQEGRGEGLAKIGAERILRQAKRKLAEL